MRQHLELPPGLDGDLWHYRNLGRSHAMHHHAELEFNLITRGSGVYLLANRKYQMRRGDLLWLFPAQEHVLIEQSVDFQMWIGVFKPAVVRRISTDSAARLLRDGDPAGEHCRRLSSQAYTRLDSLCADIAGSRNSPALFNAGLGYALASAWQLFRTATQVELPNVHPAVERAARLIRDDTTSPSLAELATRCGLSPSRLSRLFKQQTGVALVDFRNRQRIERFLRIYDGGRQPKLLDAALEAGFGSYPQFHRVFRQVIGCSPGTYQRSR